MKRRTILGQLALLMATTGPSLAQPRDGRRTIGYLLGAVRPPDAVLARHPVVRTLADLGFVEGRNLAVEWRFAAGELDRLPEMAAALVRSPAEVIVAQGGLAASAAAGATSDKPIVILGAGDPVGMGLAASLARSGRNVTGVSEASTELSGKRADLLKQLVPRASRFAVLWNANDQGMNLRFQVIEQAAKTLGVAIDAHGLRSVGDIVPALAAMTARPPDAMLLVADALTNVNRQRFLDFATQQRVPAMYEVADIVRQGGLIAYGPSLTEQQVRAAHYVARILNGARPADLPLEQPTRFYLTLNMKTARALGLEVPALLQTMADEVIE
ncbi:MAG TPA: ABC transporter substrate-binding protein [Vineibacter sp.]|nr:ABC transporter substrate-binding protein [Vineibacter sp.]